MKNIEKQKSKIKKHILRLLLILLIALGSGISHTETAYAYDATSAARKLAEMNGWTWEHIGGGCYTWYWRKFCTLDGTTGYYFASWTNWNTYPTCTRGGSAWMICHYSSDAGNSHGREVWVDRLPHEYTSNTKHANNGDGYWYRLCAHCGGAWGKTNEPITYKLHYSDTHISGTSDNPSAMTDTSHAYDTTFKLKKNAYTKTGHAFKGWATTADGPVVYTDEQQLRNLTVTHDQTINLYAVFEPIEFKVEYDARGGTIGDTTESTATTVVYYNTPVDLSVEAKKDGLVFIGWAEDENADKGLVSKDMPANDIKLYAMYSLDVSDMKEAVYVAWEKDNKTNRVSYQMDLMSIDPSGYNYRKQNIAAMSELGLTDESLLKWSIVLYDHAGNETVLGEQDHPLPKKYVQTTLHCKWNLTKQRYEPFHTTYSDLIEEGTVYTPTFLAETDSHYPFGYTPASIDPPYVVTDPEITSSITCANYNLIPYAMNFNPSGGTCEPSSKTVYVDHKIGDMATADRKGYSFIGWYTLPQGTEGATQVKSTDTYNIAGDCTVYAHWKPHIHAVTYDFKKNKGDSASAMSFNYDYDANVDLSVTAVKTGVSGLYDATNNPNGWRHIGWNVDPDATEGLKSFVMPDNDVVLYAIFEKDVTATFIDRSNDGIITRKITDYVYGETEEAEIEVPAQNTFEDWTPKGYSYDTDADAAGVVFQGTKVEPMVDTTYYGVYEQELTITYVANGPRIDDSIAYSNGYYNAADQVNSTKKADFIIAAGPIYDNHSFVAWEILDADGNVLSSHQPKDAISIDKDIVLVAKWDQYPVVESYDRYFTLKEAQDGLITSTELLSKVIATDKEDGTLQNGKDVVVLDFNSNVFKNITESTDVTICYKATDSFGNVTKKYNTIRIVDTTVTKSNTNNYVRFINQDFYKGSDGTLTSSLAGGLEDTSTWRTDEYRSSLLNQTLSNTKKNVEKKTLSAFGNEWEVEVAGSGEWRQQEETWEFKQEDIKDIKEYTDTYGQVLNAFEVFTEQFNDCKK